MFYDFCRYSLFNYYSEGVVATQADVINCFIPSSEHLIRAYDVRLLVENQ